MAYYKDLREYIKALEVGNKLVRIKNQINKDTEMMPLVRWQFRGLPEEQRKAFLFENVVDAKGKKYDIPVIVAAHAASTDVYALGMKCKPNEINEKWVQAQLHPIEPRMVSKGPVHDNVYQGDELIKRGGMGMIPVPISTPGFDNAPYLTCANWVTKDPETGIRNMGNYRAMVKSPTRLGIQANHGQHLRTHLENCKARGTPLQAAIVIGASPNIGFTGATKIPYGVDEYTIAGGIAGEPVELVKCKTVDIEVPATAEIVIEGELPVDFLEREAPFGEFTGYMGSETSNPYFNISCITYRNNPIYTAFISQFPPSESSKLRQIGNQAAWFRLLRYELNNPSVLACAFHEGSGCAFLVVQIRKAHSSDSWHVLDGAAAYSTNWPRVIIAVDEDIDPWDADSVNWAITFSCDPHRDVRSVQGKAFDLDQAAAPPSCSIEERFFPQPSGASALLIDATRKWPYRPVSLPRKEFMDRARQLWEREGLPELKPKLPWHGYTLGHWTLENEEEAELAVRGEHYLTGEKLAKARINA
ncbi:MAG: UbiD family decarboxylase [Chloroflexi bacterium]|nr:UbiD family decarboxylase [Chloroflexota bacterium]